ncbi:MAG: phage tail assembly protein [Hyphomicrobiaceae bacterium]
MLTVPKLRSAATAAATADEAAGEAPATLSGKVSEAAPPPTTDAQALLRAMLARQDLKKQPLSKPIRTHQGELRELTLRDPVAADYIEIGKVPFDVRGADEDRRATVDFKVAAQWAAALTGLDAILLGQLAAKDWLALVGRVNALLMQAGVDDVGN